MKHYICENCGQEHDGSYGSGRFCSDHCKRSFCAKKRKKFPTKEELSKRIGFRAPAAQYGTWKCRICSKVFRTRAELQQHRKLSHADKNGKVPAWNKGKNKNTDTTVMKIGQTLTRNYKNGKLISCWKNKQLSVTTRMKISKSMKKFFREHPDQAFYKRCHYTNRNYAELYFEKIFNNAGFQHKTNFAFKGYFLDFAFENVKIDFEVDGSQHKNDPKIVEHDIKRNTVILNEGWSVIRIFWPNWKKLSKDERKKYIGILFKYISGEIKSECDMIQLV